MRKRLFALLLISALLLASAAAAVAAEKVYTDPRGYSFAYPECFEVQVEKKNVILSDEATGTFVVFRQEAAEDLKNLDTGMTLPKYVKVNPAYVADLETGFEKLLKDGYTLTKKSDCRIGTKEALLYEHSKAQEGRIRTIIFLQDGSLYITMMYSRVEPYSANCKMLDRIVASVVYK